MPRERVERLTLRLAPTITGVTIEIPRQMAQFAVKNTGTEIVFEDLPAYFGYNISLAGTPTIKTTTTTTAKTTTVETTASGTTATAVPVETGGGTVTNTQATQTTQEKTTVTATAGREKTSIDPGVAAAVLSVMVIGAIAAVAAFRR